MQLYCEQEIEEYWIVDWRKKTVEIYELDYEGRFPNTIFLKQSQKKIRMSYNCFIFQR